VRNAKRPDGANVGPEKLETFSLEFLASNESHELNQAAKFPTDWRALARVPTMRVDIVARFRLPPIPLNDLPSVAELTEEIGHVELLRELVLEAIHAFADEQVL
jgi:hypothetical protein